VSYKSWGINPPGVYGVENWAATTDSIETLPVVSRSADLVQVGRDEPFKRMPHEHELEMISQDFFLLRRREAGKRPDVFVQSAAVHEHRRKLLHAGSSS